MTPEQRDTRLSAMRARIDDLDSTLATWSQRDDTRPQPEVRRAANHAMDTIDAAIRELQLIRTQLVTEIRDSDDAADARAQALLRRVRGENAK